ncbi:MAG: Rho termination factor N-terminal domain-containing protein [Ruminococcus sp.]|nr:Rho termination factor N-terminal domain-containing protein [Ruminococcus sp.]
MNTKYIIKVKNDPNYCGIGACGLHFAHGTAETGSERAAQWYSEHDGYEVTPEEDDEPEITPGGYDLGGMTVPQLKELAADLGIELGKGAKRDDIIAAVTALGGEA